MDCMVGLFSVHDGRYKGSFDFDQKSIPLAPYKIELQYNFLQHSCVFGHGII